MTIRLILSFFFKKKKRKTFQYRCAIQLGLGLDAVLDGRHFADGLASGVNPCMIDLRHGRVPLQVFERRLATLQPMIGQQHSIMKTKHLHFVDCYFYRSTTWVQMLLQRVMTVFTSASKRSTSGCLRMVALTEVRDLTTNWRTVPASSAS